MRYSLFKVATTTFQAILLVMISSTLVFSAWFVPVKKAEAGFLAVPATEATQWLNHALLGHSAVSNTATAASTAISAGNSTSQFIKENLLDGIGWAIAKQMVSNMTRSLINWINSGFQGSPSFISDFNGFLIDAIDSVVGTYIQGLGKIGEFICSPFKLDIQAALYINYERARSGMPSGPSACTLTGIGNNIKNFMRGSMGGWGQWLKVTSNPQNTPVGAYFEAQARLNARIINEQGQQIQIANWGDGFLSNKICEGINGTKTPKGQHCKITTPGKVVSEALTFQLSTGPRSLIEADEVNEVIGALINQLVLKAVSGINGLLGLSGGTGYTDYSYGGVVPYVDAAADGAVTYPTSQVRSLMASDLTTDQSFYTNATGTLVEAHRQLTIITAALTSYDILFTGPNDTANLIGLTTSNTPPEATTKLQAYHRINCITAGERGNSHLDCSAIEANPRYIEAKNEINDMLTRVAAVQTMNETINQSGDLMLRSFTNLVTSGTRIQLDLNTLIADITTLLPQATSSIAMLIDEINRYDTAPTVGTSSQSISDIQVSVALEYVNNRALGTFIDPVMLESKRAEWDLILQ